MFPVKVLVKSLLPPTYRLILSLSPKNVKRFPPIDSANLLMSNPAENSVLGTYWLAVV
jgi:hypothetical protein